MLEVSETNRKWWILAAMGGLGGLILLDESIVGVALPTIGRELGVSDVTAHWAVSAYLLFFTVFAAAAGKISDMAGMRKTFLVGTAIFGLASVAAGLAQDGALLIAARAVQGLGAAVIFPLTIAAIAIAFPQEQRGMAIGMLASICLVMLAAGPLVGGFFTELVSWRWIFWINVPILLIIAALFLRAWKDPGRETAKETSTDYVGLVTLVVGLALVVTAIMQGSQWGLSTTLALAAGGVVLLTLFLAVERRLAAPLIETDLFKIPTFAACNLVLFAGQFSKFTVVVFVALYLQVALEMSPLISGFALLVSVGASPFTAPPAGRLADRFGARTPTLAGLAVATAAMLWIGWASGQHNYLLLAPGLVLWGAALPFCFVPAQHALQGAVPEKKRGQASGIATTARLLGGTIGMSLCSLLYTLTGQFPVVFFTTGGIMLAVLIIGWLAIERTEIARAH